MVLLLVPNIISVTSNGACTDSGVLTLILCRTTVWNITIIGTGFDTITSTNNKLTPVSLSAGSSTFTSSCNTATLPIGSNGAVAGTSVICTITPIYIGTITNITFSNINDAAATFTIINGNNNQKTKEYCISYTLLYIILIIDKNEY